MEYRLYGNDLAPGTMLDRVRVYVREDEFGRVTTERSYMFAPGVQVYTEHGALHMHHDDGHHAVIAPGQWTEVRVNGT